MFKQPNKFLEVLKTKLLLIDEIMKDINSENTQTICTRYRNNLRWIVEQSLAFAAGPVQEQWHPQPFDKEDEKRNT